MALRRDEKDPGQTRSTRNRRMAKKSKQSKQHQKGLAFPRLLEQQVSRAQQQMLQGDFPGTISTCEPLLSSPPRRSSLRVEVLTLLGLAHGMLHHYQESYDLFTEALTIDPTNAGVWYNRGPACRFTTRLGQAVRDLGRAVALSRHDTSELARTFVTELEISRKDLEEAMREHGTSITMKQFIEREERFIHAMSLMRQGKWQEVELAFRQVIEMGGGLPQYWGNLGVSLIMETRNEEAEAALRRALEIDPHYTLARTNLEKIPDVRRAGGPLGIELRDLSQVQGIKQSITFSEQGQSSSSPTTHTTIEKAGNALKRTGKPLGKQPARYRFFLNPYQDARFTTCPQCRLRTRQRKYSLVIHVHSMPTLILGKTCRYCDTCDLLIAHQD
jgi:Flp pilus assembly protein TadD